MLVLAQSVDSSLQKQRRLAHTRGPIYLRHLSSRISTRDIVAGQAWRGKQLVKLCKASRCCAGAARIEALERL